MARTMIEIDESALAEAADLLGTTTKKDTRGEIPSGYPTDPHTARRHQPGRTG